MSGNRRRRKPRRDRRWSSDEARRLEQHNLKLTEYLDELAEVRRHARDNLSAAGERALKVLDGFLADLAHALGLENDRASMGDSIRYLERLPGTPAEVAGQADRFRDTRNSIFHNPDIMLRPEAAERIIDGVELIVRMAARDVRDLSHSRIVTASVLEPLADARDRMLDHGYHQLVVVDEGGGVVDLLADRDIVILEACDDVDSNGALTVADAVAARGHTAAALLASTASADEAVHALRDERIVAVVLTRTGALGEPPLGIITRGDILRSM